MSAKKANSFARWSPISLGKSQEAPKSIDSPRLAKICENRADSEATTRSHPMAIDIPAPAATPPTLAIVGLGKRWRRSATSAKARICTR